MNHPSKKRRIFGRGAGGTSRLGGKTLVLFLILTIPGCVRSSASLVLRVTEPGDTESNTFSNLSKVACVVK